MPLLILKSVQFDILQADELFPWAVGFQERLHSRHGPDRHALRVHDFTPQVHQAGVVADMGVREEDAIESRLSTFSRVRLIKPLQLFSKVWASVDHPTLLSLWVHEREADAMPAKSGVALRWLAASAGASSLRISAVLGNAK